MEMSSPVSIKKKPSLSAELVECVREFKLPQTYPSMAKDAKEDSTAPSQSSNKVQLINKSTKIIQANISLKDGQTAPKFQKLKLKSSDGRDLGEFDVQIVNQNKNQLNVQSKSSNPLTIKSDYKDNNGLKYVQLTTGKNSISSQSAAVKYLTKPIQLEVPNTPQGILIPIASNMMTNGNNENNQSSISVDNQKKQMFLVKPEKNKWQLFKNAQTTNLSPVILKPHANDDQVMSTNSKQVTTVPQKVQLTHNSRNVTYKNDKSVITTGVKRKIDESSFKPAIVKDKKFVNIGNSNIVMKLEGIDENNDGENVIYVVPSNDNPTESESIRNTEMVENKSKFLRNSLGRVNLIRRGRKNVLVNKSFFDEVNETSQDHLSQNTDSLPNNDSLNDDSVGNDFTSKLSIVGHALSTIGDEELKAKALKALADCGIGIERFVPIKSPDLKSIKESHCQTNVFGLLDKKNFIKVDGESDALERIQEIEKKIDSIEVSQVTSNNTVEFADNLNKMLDTFCVNKINVEQMRDIFKVHPLVERAHFLLEKDFKNCKKLNKNGLLRIHKAVLSNQEKAVYRQIMVLKNCKASVDLPTTDGQTSLELAVRHGISTEIIQMLLKAGAKPTASESHDSALALASKQSSPILLEFIPYLSSTNPAINNVDSEGCTALHYCAINGYEEGVDELIRIQVDLNARDCKSGRTALFHALENEHLQICKKLLIHGAKGNIPNFAGQTVLTLFDDEKHYIIRDSLHRSVK